MREVMEQKVKQAGFKGDASKLSDADLFAKYNDAVKAEALASAPSAQVLAVGAASGDEIPAAEAAKYFRSVKVQRARRVEKEIDGKKRKVFETEMAACEAKDILRARLRNGIVSITTIDGRRHEARA